jgi:hypothetical protein
MRCIELAIAVQLRRPFGIVRLFRKVIAPGAPLDELAPPRRALDRSERSWAGSSDASSRIKASDVGDIRSYDFRLRCTPPRSAARSSYGGPTAL